MVRLHDIVEATGGIIGREGALEFSALSIDSRTIKEGELFIALKGDRYDGHDFVVNALERAAGAIVEKEKFKTPGHLMPGRTIVFVGNTLDALHAFARFLRRKFAGPVISIVGSNGKTTTKELIASILGVRARILKTAGNFNNHIGMPFSITRCDEETEIMVLEMGTSRPGDVDELCRIALPDTAVITNIGYEHIEGFGSLQTVRDSELEILPYVRRMIANADDAFLMEGILKTFRGEIVTFGIESGDAEVKARDIAFSESGTRFVLSRRDESIIIDSNLWGYFNIYNCLAAAATASALGFTLQEIKRGIECFKGFALRFEVKQHNGVLFLNDAYNANPSSMEASIRELVRIVQASGGKRAVAALGDMLELGEYAEAAHEKLGRWIAELPIAFFVGVGPLMSFVVNQSGGKGISAATPEAAGAELRGLLREGDVVLIKGSRGMKMEKALDVLLQGVPERISACPECGRQ